MSGWKMLRSEEFTASRDGLYQVFRDETRAVLAKHSPPLSKAFHTRQEEFFAYLDFLDELHQGDLDPEDHLGYVTKDQDGLDLYSAVRGSWRCLFKVDRSDNRDSPCGSLTAQIIHQIGDTLINIEAERHRPDNRLKCPPRKQA